jgi:hypothetical protein
MEPLKRIPESIGSKDLRSNESGQAAISFVLMLGLFLLGVLGFSVDLTNMWFHRQAATAAADAACQAGAMDMLGLAGGLTLSKSGFTPGTSGDCVANSAATMCTYALANGYNGTGLKAGAESNSVSWTFPASVTGVTPGAGAHPFMKLSISENVKSYFASLLTGSGYQKVVVASTCGLVQVKAAAPMVVLHPTMAGSFTYSGGGALYIVGGPPRGLQVNSSSATAVSWAASGMINLTKGGPNQTGSDVGITGGPTQSPGSGTCNTVSGFCTGSTGAWRSNTLPMPDPFGSVPAPSKPANAPAVTYVPGPKVNSDGSITPGVDGCPDHRSNYLGGQPNMGCAEYSPGYYPSGLTPISYITSIFKPGIYYMNGPLNIGGSATVRVAKPSGFQATDGVMFYFLTGSLNISGGSGTPDRTDIDPVPSSALTCDGSVPSSSLNMSSLIDGNVLIAQCARDGTYWNGSDTTDARGTPGSRGILVYQAHSNTTQFAFSGSGSLAYSGALYLHSTGYNTVLNMSGGTSSGTFILGEIIADQVKLIGSGRVNLALNPQATTNESKVALLQ